MTNEQTLVLIKPDTLVKSLTGNVISSLSETKLKLVGAKVVKVSKELAEKHYSELRQGLLRKFGEEKGGEIFESTLKYIQGHYHTDRVVALVYEGEDAVKKIRAIAGPTNPEEADPSTIRGRYGRINTKTQVFENVVHVSDSPENAKREIQIWFSPEDLTSIIFPTKKEQETFKKIVWE